MRQVLFHIGSLPIFGFGFMLFVAFVACTWLAGRRAQQQGIAKEYVQDLAVWLFISGILGARIVYMIQFGVPIWQIHRIWEGGLVFYGSALGGVVGFGLYYYFVIRKHGLNSWQLADIVAPSIALGLCLGRIGCLLNGCCYGHVACVHCPAVHFPLSAPPRFTLVQKGYQTTAGFALRAPERPDDRDPAPRTVLAVEADSPAAEAGLQPGDVITGADGAPIASYEDLWNYLVRDWPRGKTDLELTVQRGTQTLNLPPFFPTTIGLHPTQLYETISMVLLALLLLAYEPFQRRRGELIVVLMLCYSVHRFLNESLRDDTPPVAFGLTLSQNGSILLFLAGVGLLIQLLRKPPDLPSEPAPAPQPAPAPTPA